MPDKVNARYGAKASDLSDQAYPMGMKEISALDTIRLRSSGERQADYYVLSCLANSGDEFLTSPKSWWEGSEAKFPSGPGWGSSGKADCERDSSCCRQVGNGLGPGPGLLFQVPSGPNTLPAAFVFI